MLVGDATFFMTNVNNWKFWGGMVLGIQQDQTNTAHECYQSFLSVQAQANQISQFIVDLAAKTAAGTNTGNSVAQQLGSDIWMMPGTYFVIGKKYFELSSVFMTTYR